MAIYGQNVTINYHSVICGGKSFIESAPIEMKEGGDEDLCKIDTTQKGPWKQIKVKVSLMLYKNKL